MDNNVASSDKNTRTALTSDEIKEIVRETIQAEEAAHAAQNAPDQDKQTDLDEKDFIAEEAEIKTFSLGLAPTVMSCVFSSVSAIYAQNVYLTYLLFIISLFAICFPMFLLIYKYFKLFFGRRKK